MIESPKIWRYLLFGILEYISLIYTIIKQNFILKKLMVKKKKNQVLVLEPIVLLLIQKNVKVL